ncbi:DUF885 domain-containing protein [Amycolatopsis aidingensis]|uniref:DUF885 domain-containing protein n=1 Tax=Amycolatopsis aidingensis TaxID=2842453 RepID=UPI001C0AE02C|nr:DUF885 domain-containing protein [Amycolatopsis aidingensis]
MTDVVSLADELVDTLFRAEPLWPAVLGLEQSRPGLGELSAEAEAALRADLAALRARAEAIEPEGLAAQDRITREVAIAMAGVGIDDIDSRFVEFAVSDLFVSPAADLLTRLPLLAINGADEERAQLDRLASIPGYLEQALERHRAGVAAGLVPVGHQVEAAVRRIDQYLAEPAADPLLRQQAPSAGFERRRAELLERTVRPAFRRYRDGVVAEIAAHGRPPERPGACWLPDGERIYATLARARTSVEVDPARLHETGLRLVAELAEEYAEIGGRVFGTSDLGEIFRRLRTDPALRWKDERELLDGAREAISRAERAAPDWFGRIPPDPWVVRPVPEADGPNAPLAYYFWPSADGSRPGTYFANTYQVTERFRHTCEATAFHEVIPGHHFQSCIALRLDDLPLLRRVSSFPAYNEGWGLYTERLAREMDLYSGDVALLGMLSIDSLRAGRLVVDTGLHAKGWSREQAVDFLVRNTPMGRVEIESEVDRYIAWPGQALSYMVGRLEIQRIRAEAERALGPEFDIREFHDVVLGGGSVPLPVLDGMVREWARSNEKGARA